MYIKHLNILLESLFQFNYMYTLFSYAYLSIITIFKVSTFSMKFDGLKIDNIVIQYIFYIVILSKFCSINSPITKIFD